MTRQWPDAHAEFECAAKQAPNKVQRRKHELHLRIRRWIKVESRRLRQMGLVFCASPNTSRQIRLAKYTPPMAPRQLRVASYVLRLAVEVTPICLGSCISSPRLRSCIKLFASPQSPYVKYVSPITPRQFRLENYVSPVATRHKRCAVKVAPICLDFFSRYCASTLASSPSHLRNILSPKNKRDNYVSKIMSRSHLYFFLV